MNMSKCSNCGASLREGASFCSCCGQAVRQAVFCSKCGAELNVGDNFCFACGTAVNSPVAAVTETKAAHKIDWSTITLDDDVLEDPPAPAWPVYYPENKKSAPAAANGEVYPNLFNFDNLFVDLYTSADRHSQVKDGKLEVLIRYNDAYSDITLPEYFLFGNFDIARRSEAENIPVKGLQNVTAYALSDTGIYFSYGSGKINFMDKYGQITEVGEQKNVIALTWEGTHLVVEYVLGYHQIAENEHRDLMGYTDEAWYNVYKVNTAKRTIAL